MSEVRTIGIDLAKQMFSVHGVDRLGKILRIPVHAGHQFRSMPGHDSGPCRATIPVDAGRGV
jgi:hypothetical protein